MKLEYWPQGPSDSGLIRLYEYEQEEVRALRQIAEELAFGIRETILLNGENWVTPICGCSLVLKREARQLEPWCPSTSEVAH